MYRGVPIRLILAVSVVPLLTGCPLSDDYYVDSNYGRIGVGGGSGSGGTSAIAGKSTLGGATTTASTLCTADNCSNTCCDGQCIDTTNDPSNCGGCATVCPGGQACVIGVCKSGWASMAPAPASFVAREKVAFVSMGERLFLFGGADSNDNSLNDGAIYDPKTNRWTLIAVDSNTPSTRRFATAVWTGSSVLVLGGRNDMVSEGDMDAAIYDPAAGHWLSVPSNSTGRVSPIGVSSSLFSAFWGGWGANSAVLSGTERFDWSNSTWTAATSTTYSDPGVLAHTAYAFTGQYLYLYGGLVNSTTKTNAAYSYNLQTNAWSSLASTSSLQAPSARYGAFGVWDGTSFYVWGGHDDTNAKNDGAAWNAGVWKPMAQLGAPSMRWAPARQSGWAFARGTGDLIIIGGQDALGNYQKNGGRYTENSAGAGTWAPIPNWPSGENHQTGVAAYVGGALIVWGGHNGTVATATGERWAP